MKQIPFEEVKQLELAILADVADFCESNGLEYFLAYGTLIGAVRHKGFIPWDDDIDIWMPRKDYDKFLSSYKSKSGYYRAVSPCDSIARHSMVKVIDTRTAKIEPCIDYKGSYLGVDIDIFPLDGEPDSEDEFSVWFKKLHKLYMEYFYLCVDPKSSKSSLLFSTLLRLCGMTKAKLMAKAGKLHSQYPYESCDIVGSVETIFNSECNRFKKEWFENSLPADFEGYKFRIPSGYDKILTAVYGDYMQLPPEDQQVTHHSNNSFWLEA